MAVPVGMGLVIKTTQAAVGVIAGKGVIAGCLTARGVVLADEAMRGTLGSSKLAALVLAVGVIVGGVGWVGYKTSAEPSELPQPQFSRDAQRSAESLPRRAVAVDQYGDALPEGAVARLGTMRLRNNGWLKGVAFSPNGKILASTGMDEAIRLWDAKTGKLVAALENAARIPTECMAFSPDGTMLVAGGLCGEVRLWDVQTRSVLFEKQTQGSSVNGIAFAPDGLSFASAAGNVQVWKTPTGTEVHTLGAVDAGSRVVAFSPDGKLLATNRQEDICVWDAKTGALLRLVPTHAAQINSVCFTDNTTLAAAGNGQPGPFEFWDAATGKRIAEVAASKYVGSLTSSPDRKRLAAAYEDKIRIWDMLSAAKVDAHTDVLIEVGRSSFQNHLTFSPDGKTLAAIGLDNVVRLWDLSTGKRLLGFSDAHSGRVVSVAFHPDGRKVLTSGQEGSVRLWDPTTGKQLRLYQNDSKLNVWSVSALSPDGKIVAAGNLTVGNGNRIYSCTVWDANTGRQIRAVPCSPGVHALAFTPNGEKLAFAGDVGSCTPGETETYLWDFSSDKPLVKLPNHEAEVVMLSFLTDGITLASVSSMSLNLYDTASKKDRAKCPLPKQAFGACFSADRKIVVISESSGEMLVVREVATGKLLSAIKVKDTLGSILALSPDGRILASSQIACLITKGDYDVTIHLWEMATGREILRFQPRDSVTSSLSFSADGRKLISGMENGTALIWNVKPATSAFLSPEKLGGLWRDLAHDDAAVAYAAVWRWGPTRKQACRS